jgi:acetyl esterase/lipase
MVLISTLILKYMKGYLLLIVSMVIHLLSIAQPPSSTQVEARLPKGTIIHGNVPYNNDTLKKHLLDIYVPADAKGKVPIVVFIHGGGWIGNDKYADMGYMPILLRQY